MGPKKILSFFSFQSWGGHSCGLGRFIETSWYTQLSTVVTQVRLILCRKLTKMVARRLPFAFITQEVVEATCQCLLACAGEGDKQKLPFHEVERSVLEEFGHCLLAIIDSANKTKGRPPDRSSDKRPEPTHQVQPCFTQDRSSVRRTKTARRMLDL